MPSRSVDVSPRIQPVPTGQTSTPTAEFYFARAHAGEIERGAMADGTPLSRPAPGVFALGAPVDRWVVLRDAPPPLVRTILRGSPRRLAVLVDDDGPAIARDFSQPAPYRFRQWRSHQRRLALLRRATHALAPSDALMGGLREWAPRALHRRIDPVLPRGDLPPLDHHRADGPLTLLLSDTRSHAGDAAAVAPHLRAALDANPRLHLVTHLRDRAPPALRHDRAEHRAPLPWDEFAATSHRAHVLLAPRRVTPVNAARSTTRVLDAAMAGAVGLYGHVPAIAVAVRGTLPDWTHGDVDWRVAIARLAADPDERLDLARRTAGVARRLGSVERQRSLWREVLA